MDSPVYFCFFVYFYRRTFTHLTTKTWTHILKVKSGRGGTSYEPHHFRPFLGDFDT